MHEDPKGVLHADIPQAVALATPFVPQPATSSSLYPGSQTTAVNHSTATMAAQTGIVIFLEALDRFNTR